jgi:hypothetical protein
MEQPLFLAQAWSITGLPSNPELIGRVYSEEKRNLEEKIEVLEQTIQTQRSVIETITYYAKQQENWWQAAPESDDDSLVENQFKELAARWYKETRHISSLTKIILNPAYQRIIGLGPMAVRFILRELEQRPNHWFWALESITGENPVQPDDDFDSAVQAWLRWGQEHSLM